MSHRYLLSVSTQNGLTHVLRQSVFASVHSNVTHIRSETSPDIFPCMFHRHRTILFPIKRNRTAPCQNGAVWEGVGMDMNEERNMDIEQQQAASGGTAANSGTTSNSGQADTCGRGTATQGGQGGACACGQDLLSCIPMPAGLCAVLRRLRAPAMSLTYRLDECFIPDLDAAGGSSSGSQGSRSGHSANPGCSGNSASSGASYGASSDDGIGTASRTTPGRNREENVPATACRMYKEGNVTVRLFDLGLAVVLMTAAGCMIKCWCGCARGMKSMCRKMF